MNQQAKQLSQLSFFAIKTLMWAMEASYTLEGEDWCNAEHKLLADLRTAHNHKEDQQ